MNEKNANIKRTETNVLYCFVLVVCVASRWLVVVVVLVVVKEEEEEQEEQEQEEEEEEEEGSERS